MESTHEMLKSNFLYSCCAFGLGVALFLFVSSQRDPLSHVPGPWYAQWTGAVATYHWLAGRKPAYIHALHLKYGPIVRVGPREVYLVESLALRKIYGFKNEFAKANWYSDLSPFSTNIFNTTDVGLHRRYRRLLSSPISESGLKSHPQIDAKVNLAIQRMKEECGMRGAADIYKWWLFLATDVIGELSFGESFKMLESGKMNQYVADLQNEGRMGSYRAAFPGLFRISWNFRIPLPRLNAAIEENERMGRYVAESLQRHRKLVESEASDARDTVFTKVYKAEGDKSITQIEVEDNARSYIVAGSDTTANTLTYLVWSVCRDEATRSRLVTELDALPEDFTYDQLRLVPFLDCVIDETLRIFPPAPSGLPREVPAGGTELCGHHIPGGYIVATQNYSMHRGVGAFQDPEKFDPSRWEHPTPAMNDSFMPFGAGSRICIGLHLAKIELRLATARFFKAFPNAKVSTLENMSEKDMVPEMYFLAGPRGHRCLIQVQ